MSSSTTDTSIRPGLTEYDEIMLTNSIKVFMKELQSDVPNFFDLRIHSSHLLQKSKDPPFEFLCFYLAISYHNCMRVGEDPLYVAKELFQLSIMLSTPRNPLKSVAIIAPIIHVLHKSCVGLSKADVCLGREIKKLLERIFSYIFLNCCLENQSKGIEQLSNCFRDMMRVWTMDQVESNCEPVDHLRLFFPLLSDEVRLQINVCYRTDYLAGAVMVEILMLLLQFKLYFGVPGIDLQMDMSAWILQILKEFKNFTFYDMLFRMMLEPSLPVTTLLSSEEERLLRRVLFDAVLLGELPFLKSGRFSQLHESHLKNMFLAWLLVADNAIEFEREYGAGQHATTVSYTEAFSRSDIPNLLIELVANEIGMKEKLSRPNTPTPRALIKWLLGLQDHGIRVFEDCSTLHAKATTCSLRQDYGLLEFKPAGDYSTPDTFLDLNGANKVCVDQEMVHLHSPISTVACPVNLTSTQGRRKRDEEMNEEEPQAKIVKCEFHNSPVTSISLPPAFGDTLISGSQSNNITTTGLCAGDEKKETSSKDADEEMEDME